MYCKLRQLGRPKIYSEVVSGSGDKLASRIELRRLLDDVEPGDIVVVSRVDRWSRDIVHAVESVRELVAKGIAWHSAGDGIDASTPNGDSMLGIMAWAADNERKRIRERTVGRRRALRDEGLYVDGRVPIGYERANVSGKGKNVLQVVPGSADVVVQMFEQCANGSSLRDIASWLRSTTPQLARDRQVLHRMLRNRVYLGEVRTTAGEWIHAHEPIITHQLFQQAQAGLKSRTLGGRRSSEESHTKDWIMRGHVVCLRCGSPMRSAYRSSPSTDSGYLFYYACSGRVNGNRKCDASYVRVDHVEPIVAEMVVQHLDKLREQLAQPTKKARKPKKPRTSAKQLAHLQKKRERTIDLAADGLMAREELTTRLAAIDSEVERLTNLDAARARDVELTTDDAKRGVLKQVRAIQRSWSKAPPAVQREVLQNISHHVAIEKGKRPRVKWRKLGELVKEL